MDRRQVAEYGYRNASQIIESCCLFKEDTDAMASEWKLKEDNTRVGALEHQYL
jgi:hypothetical protein